MNLPEISPDNEETLTCERSCETAWPLSCDGVRIGVLRGGWRPGGAVDLRELKYQLGGRGGAPRRPVFKRPDLCEGNLLRGRGLGVRTRGLCLVPAGGAAGAGARTAGGARIQDDSCKAHGVI